jgi:hypothetical protein
MRELSILSVSALNLAILVSYCWLLYKKRIKPALAMWVFFTIAVAMCLVTYLSSSRFSIWDNILNATDLVLCATVAVAIAIWGDHTSRFTRFDRGCLVAVLCIVLFWGITQNHVVTNVLVQAILVIAYFPVVRRLYEAKENTESFVIWIGMLLAPLLSLLSARGELAYVYTLRAVVCVGVLLLLMLRVELARKRSGR